MQFCEVHLVKNCRDKNGLYITWLRCTSYIDEMHDVSGDLYNHDWGSIAYCFTIVHFKNIILI